VKNVFIAIVALFGAAVSASDAPVDVYVELLPPVVPFHRQAEYRIVVDVTGDVSVLLPDMVGKFGGVDVADVRRHSKVLKDGRRRLVESYVLDPIVAATYAIYPAEVQWGPEKKSVVVPSPALRVRELTEAEIEAAEAFAPIAGPLSVPKPLWLRPEFWLAVVAVGALAGALVVFGLTRREKAERAAAAPPPWEVAYERLRVLDEQNLPEAGRYKPYYIELSSILRYYIEDRFHLHAPEQTTPEFLDAAARSGLLSEVHQRLVAHFLRHCDRVKFARYEPTVEEMERSFEVVLQFVDETAPPPEHEGEGDWHEEVAVA